MVGSLVLFIGCIFMPSERALHPWVAINILGLIVVGVSGLFEPNEDEEGDPLKRKPQEVRNSKGGWR